MHRLRMSFVVVAGLFFIRADIRGQTPAEGAPAKLKSMPKGADPRLEVATVKRSDPNDKNETFAFRGRHLVIKEEPVEVLLMVGFGVQKGQIVGAPDWVKSELYDVDGVPDVEGEPDLLQSRSMIQKLLVERFGLKLHHEQQEMPVYALTVTKHGEKMVASDGHTNTSVDNDVAESDGHRTVRIKSGSTEDLALFLKFFLDRPVVDQTGLKGRYDLKLTWTFDDSRAPTDGTAPPGIFTAIQEQLGLKLEPEKAPADVLVIDQVERPGAN